MSSLVLWLTVLLAASTMNEQQPAPNQTAAQAPPARQTPQKEPQTHRADFFSKIGGTSIFIYGTEVDPCATLPLGTTLLPRGSGFVSGIEKKGASTPQMWNGWKFVVTAKHVVANQGEVILRVNADDKSKFICKRVKLHILGPEQNVLLADSGVDLAAVFLPEIEGYSSTVVPSAMLIDEEKMQEWSIGVGTEVLTVGYLFSYSGQKANYPVVKFGHISMISDEFWYFNDQSRLMEQGYVLDLSNAPGLSGSAVFAHGVEMEANPFRYRELPPYLVGVVKGLMLAPVGGTNISQGVAVIEPAFHVKELMRKVAIAVKNGGGDVEPID
jgi:hypothetical protein